MIQELAKFCSEQILDEKWILCSDRSIAQILKDRINFDGTPTINVHGKSIRSLAWELIHYRLVSCHLIAVEGESATALVHELLSQALEKKKLHYFSRVQHTDSMARVVWRSLNDLRQDGITHQGLSESNFESPAKANDLKEIYGDFLKTLTDRKLVDYAACLELLIDDLDSGSLKLPKGLTILIPSELRLTKRESQFLESIRKRDTIIELCTAPYSSQVVRDRIQVACHSQQASFDFFAGNGEANEVRELLRRILYKTDSEAAMKLDNVEVIVSDSSIYAPLLYEILCEIVARRSHRIQEELSPPITFGDGIPCVYARSGRGLRAWLRWLRTDCMQAKSVQMMREGILKRPEGQEIGYARLAANLRRLPIGFGIDRYLPAIQTAQSEAQLRKEAHTSGNATIADSDEPIPDFGLPTLNLLHQIFDSLVRFAPRCGDSSRSILHKAKQFLLHSVRAEDRLDRIARNQLLEEIEAKSASLEFAEESPESILAWLEELPIESCILQSGPAPGCLHVCSLKNGGFTGRKNVFFMGLDSTRFPKLKSPDPILLDSERSKLSASLLTSDRLTQFEQEQLYRAIDRILETRDVQIQLSYSARDLIEDRSLSPSPEYLEVFRIAQNNPHAHIEDVNTYIGSPCGFVGDSEARWLDASEGMVAHLLTEPSNEVRRRFLESHQPHVKDIREADANRASPEFTQYDGWVPEAAEALSPNNPAKSVSANRLEAMGTCPRRYFFKYGLGVFPPDEWEVDPEKWLDALQRGSLVHSVFEKFLGRLTREDKVPSLERDLPKLVTILESELELLKATWPVRNQGAYETERSLLMEMCETFLREDEAYCAKYNAQPWVLEASIGLEDSKNPESRSPIDSKEPVDLTLNDGRLLRVAGRIDRIDRYMEQGSESYAIWDYKTGSDYEYSQSDPFQEGRKLQSFLYVGMLRHRLAATERDKDSPISFGYFFPGPKTNGLRLQWTHGELKEGDTILSHLCDLVAHGAFPATTNKDDCTYCDYKKVCGDAEWVASDSMRMYLYDSNDVKLGPWKKLRVLKEKKVQDEKKGKKSQ